MTLITHHIRRQFTHFFSHRFAGSCRSSCINAWCCTPPKSGKLQATTTGAACFLPSLCAALSSGIMQGHMHPSVDYGPASTHRQVAAVIVARRQQLAGRGHASPTNLLQGRASCIPLKSMQWDTSRQAGVLDGLLQCAAFQHMARNPGGHQAHRCNLIRGRW